MHHLHHSMKWLSSSSYLFLFGLVLSYIMFLSMGSLLFLWISIELNFYSMIPLLMFADKQSKKSPLPNITMNFFLSQVVGSICLITAIISFYSIKASAVSSILFISAILIKMALPPAHSWFILSIAFTTPIISWLMMTLQKLPGLILLHIFLSSAPTSHLSLLMVLMLMITLSYILSSSMATELMNPKIAIGFSSLGQMTWLMWAAWLDLSSMIFFFFLYSLSLIPLLMNSLSSKEMSNTFLHSWFGSNVSKQKSTTFSLIFLMISSIPPSIMFIPKMKILLSIFSNSLWPLLPILLIVILSTAIMGYLYVSSTLSFLNPLPYSTLKNTTYYPMKSTLHLYTTLPWAITMFWLPILLCSTFTTTWLL